MSSGGYPAPPHDETGHTWHHPDELLFRITKHGGATAVLDGIKSDMHLQLADEQIWAVLAYTKSRWPEEVRRRHAQMSIQVSG